MKIRRRFFSPSHDFFHNESKIFGYFYYIFLFKVKIKSENFKKFFLMRKLAIFQEFLTLKKNPRGLNFEEKNRAFWALNKKKIERFGL